MYRIVPFFRWLGRLFFHVSFLRSLHKTIVWFCERYIQAWSAYNFSIDSINLAEFGKQSHGFEYLYWLFNSSPSNRGLLRMDFDEASLLYRLCSSIEKGTILEIGRYNGGSTILIASSLRKNSTLVSIDKNPRDDVSLSSIIERIGLIDKVSLICSDSLSFETEEIYDVIFIDGNHSYEAVRSDYEKWGAYIRKGGYLIFHDASKSRWNSTSLSGPNRLVREIENNSDYLFFEEVGSLSCFQRL